VHSRRCRTFGARRSTKLGGLALVACLLAPLLGIAGAGAATGDNLGASAGHMVLWESDMEQVADLNAVYGSGAKWLALDIDWASIEYQRGKYRWHETDRIILLAKQRGLRVLGVVAYSPQWASGPTCPPGETHCLPVRAEDYAAFAQTVVRRYGNFATNVNFRGGLSGIQVWNEPNHYPFVQQVDVLKYVSMLKLTYPAVRGVDAYQYVLAGGLSPAPDSTNGKDMSPTSFLHNLYFWGARGSFDAVGHHPYSFPCSPLVNAPWNAFQQTLALRWVMAYNGDGAKRIWGTETGTPTGSPVGTCETSAFGKASTEPVQALYAAQAILRWTKEWGSFTGPLFWFQIRDNGTNPAVVEDNFGLLRRNYSQKMAFGTFQQLAASP
jgi:polysaccharide biosynthesis protein PslG